MNSSEGIFSPLPAQFITLKFASLSTPRPINGQSRVKRKVYLRPLWKVKLKEAAAKIRFSRFSGSFETILRSFLEAISRCAYSPPKKTQKRPKQSRKSTNPYVLQLPQNAGTIAPWYFSKMKARIFSEVIAFFNFFSVSRSASPSRTAMILT